MGDASQAESIYQDREGEMTVRRLTAQLLATSIRGVGSPAMVHWYIRQFHGFVDAAPAKVDIFHDWAGLTSFSSDARVAFARWLGERRDLNRRACRGAHTLVTSPLHYLAIEATHLLTRGYAHAYRDRAAFELARQHALYGPSPLPFDRADGAGATAPGPGPAARR